MKRTFLAASFLALSLGGCAANTSTVVHASEQAGQTGVQWSLVDSVDVEAINSDLEIGKPTVDIGLYYPSNLEQNTTSFTCPLDRKNGNWMPQLYCCRAGGDPSIRC